MSISRQEKVMCGWCYNISTLGEWDDLTYSKCTNREMKRAYTKLSEEKAFLRKSDTFYLCPICGKWIRGCQLKIAEPSEPRLAKLGGEQVVVESKFTGA